MHTDPSQGTRGVASALVTGCLSRETLLFQSEVFQFVDSNWIQSSRLCAQLGKGFPHLPDAPTTGPGACYLEPMALPDPWFHIQNFLAKVLLVTSVGWGWCLKELSLLDVTGMWISTPRANATHYLHQKPCERDTLVVENMFNFTSPQILHIFTPTCYYTYKQVLLCVDEPYSIFKARLNRPNLSIFY